MRLHQSISLRALFAAVACVVGACSNDVAPKRTPTGRDLVLIVIDTLRADRLSCYGNDHATSPAIDALARTGVRVADCTSQSSWTGPSMVSLMTGRRVARDFVRMAHVITLAERLKQAGYATIAFQWNALLNAGSGYERGFDHYAFRPRAVQIGNRLRAMPDGPRFIYVHLTDPHDPYAPDANFDTFGPRPARPERVARLEAFIGAHHADWTPEQIATAAAETEARMQKMSALYDGEVAQADQTVKNLLGVLERLGRLERSIVVIAADHGESLFDHREAPTALAGGDQSNPMRVWKMGHAALLAESLLRVPLIINGPGVPAAVVLGGPQENVDIVPTALELLGIDADFDLDGESLVPKFRAHEQGGTAVGKDFVYANTSILSSVRARSGWKLVVPWPSAILERPALYDLRNDPHESNPIAAEGEVAQKLAQAIESFRSTALIAQRAEDVLDDEVKKRMQELGYVGAK